MYLCTFVLITIAVVHSFNISVPKKISGPWYYIADGLDKAHPFDTMPSWFKNAGNFVSLAFMNPADLPSSADPVPEVFKNLLKVFVLDAPWANVFYPWIFTVHLEEDLGKKIWYPKFYHQSEYPDKFTEMVIGLIGLMLW